jgi:hypothetical protein
MEIKLGSQEGPSNFENWVSLAKSVSDLLIAFAWPLALVVVVVSFRREISGLLGRLQSADVAGAKVEFGDKIETLQRQLPDIAEKVLNKLQDQEDSAIHSGDHIKEDRVDVVYSPSPIGGAGSKEAAEEEGVAAARLWGKEVETLRRTVENISEQINYSDTIYSSNPKERLFSSWDRLELSLNNLFRVKFPTNFTTGTENRLNKLAERGVIPLAMFNSIKDLSSLRNEVTHRSDLSIGPAEASEFVRTATQMRQMLELLASPPAPQRQR